MPAPSTGRVTVATPVLAALCGALLGLGSFGVSAALWRAGDPRLAGITAQGCLLLALACLAGFILLAGRPGGRRARVVAGEPLPQVRWLPEADPVPVLAVCAGTPLVTGAAAAVLLFH